MQDCDLVQATLKGSRDAFSELVRRHTPALLSLCRSFLRDPGEGEDVVQESFMVAFQKLAGLKDRARFPAWLYQIARNRCRNRLEKTSRAPAVQPLSAVAEVVAAPPGVEPESHPVWGAMGRLPEEMAQVLRLRHVEGQSLEQIATLMGLTLSGVNTRLFRARKLLRQSLEEKTR